MHVRAPYQRGTTADRLAAGTIIEPTGCWRWIGSTTTSGYGHLSISDVYYQAHRLMYTLHRGPVTTPAMDHLCRNRWCVNPWHLEPVSHQENMRRGARTRLDAEKVRAIRVALAAGTSQRAIGRLFGIDHSTVSRVKNGSRWSDVTDLADIAA